jgi:ribosomal protein S1
MVTLEADESARLHIEVAHLCDHPALVEAALQSMHAGLVLPKVLVIDKHATSHRVRLSLKPSLVAAAEDKLAPKTITDFKPHQLLCGYICSITSFGYFVKLWNGFIGLASKLSVARMNLSDPDSVFTVGRSVVARVAKVWMDA